MKKILFFVAVAVFTVALFMSPNGTNCGAVDSKLLRIHIRANSNVRVDQNVKYEIKGELVKFLTPKVASVVSVAEAEKVVSSCLNEIDEICNNVLRQEGFSYEAKSKLANEYFPDRVYEGYVVERGFYDALVVELGDAAGDNWWCVIYPPLCFVNAVDNGTSSIVYKSKLWDIIKEFFEK